jgi:hypothetical protein
VSTARAASSAASSRSAADRAVPPAQPPARIALAGEQHLLEALRLAEGVAAFQQAHQRRGAELRAAVDVAVLARHHVGQLAALVGHAQALAHAFSSCALRCSWPMCFGRTSAGVVPLPRSCVRQAKRTG